MTELGNLSQCMVGADREDLRQARRRRGRAVALSVGLQVVCVAALLVVPLLAVPGALPPDVIFTPVPPYRGGGGAVRPRPHHAPARSTQSVLTNRLIFPTARAALNAHEASSDTAPPDIRPQIIGDLGPGDGRGPAGPYIPGGNETGVRIPPPRQPIAPQRLIHRSEGVMAGSLVHRVDPQYPEIAKAIHLSGTVRLRAIISTDGRVQDLEVLSGSPILANAAVAAVRQWRYRPTLLSETAVEVETFITVNFVLSQ